MSGVTTSHIISVLTGRKMIINARVRRIAVMMLAACLMTVEPSLAQQHPVAEAQIHQRDATQSYRDGDFEGFTRSLETALELNPASFATQYNLACGYALTGRATESLDLLEKLARAKVDFGMARDPDLTSLHDTDRFKRLVALLAHPRQRDPSS